MSKRALVTGACGFVGSHLLEALIERGWNVIGTDLEEAQRNEFYAERASSNEKMPNPSYYGDLIEELDISFIPSDITNKTSLEPLFKDNIDVVFHTASLYDYFAEWDKLRSVNINGARNIGEKAAKNDVSHFIHWSTLGVTGGNKANRDAPLREDAQYAPHNRYGDSKVKQEKVLRNLQDEAGLPLTIIRPAPIYGPRNNYGVYHLLYLYRKIGTVLMFPIYPRRYQLRFPCVHVQDVVRAALFIHSHQKRTLGETYHVTSDPIKQDELVSFFAESLGLPEKRIPLPWPFYQGAAMLLLKLAKHLEKRAREKDTRPKFPASMAQYLQSDFWFTNEKLRNEGFDFLYQDPRKGLWNYITWCKDRGML